ncbi:hypothetical protein F2P81_002411 [Scophthalmus maximus]|uniref:Uncharacterized protein n=1 Tax=Scophthalmus maximus TaxID=52904 RepID=A0A6A4TV43_SCOMX|nr:hypothetical protein F2P81_002411 [Scophthalmus maximus]
MLAGNISDSFMAPHLTLRRDDATRLPVAAATPVLFVYISLLWPDDEIPLQHRMLLSNDHSLGAVGSTNAFNAI